MDEEIAELEQIIAEQEKNDAHRSEKQKSSYQSSSIHDSGKEFTHMIATVLFFNRDKRKSSKAQPRRTPTDEV